MKPSEMLPARRELICRVVEAHAARNPRVFGSVLHGNDREGSDLDILVDDTPRLSLMQLARMETILAQRLGFKVDVVTPEDLPPSFRARVLAEAQPI